MSAARQLATAECPTNMPRYAVGYTNAFDNILTVKIVEAIDWRTALIDSGLLGRDKEGAANTVASLPEGMEEAKEEAFNQDWQFDVIEVP